MKKIIRLLLLHSNIIVWCIFCVYFFFYNVLLLYMKSVYYNYIMLLLLGVFLGYQIAIKYHRLLKQNGE